MLKAAVTVSLAAALALAGPAQAQPDAAPGELIVRFDSGVDAGERAAVRERADVTVEEALPVRGLQLVEVEGGQTVAAAERALERSDAVLYAEPNFYRRAFVRPSDTYFRYQWSLENTGQTGGATGADIGAVRAWDVTTSSPDVVVAVVDTGVFLSHPDLAGSGWTNPGEEGAEREANGVDDDGNGLVDDWRGWDWVADDGDPADENGHGTHVAGTVAARSDNGRGVAGTSWHSRVMPLRVLGADGSGTVADVVRAYRYAAAEGAQIVNASLGSSTFSLAEQDAIASAAGTLFVVAAGNGGADGVGDDNDSDPTYPCAYPLANVVCVAATDQSDELAGFSNRGVASVDLAAPGVRILSTWTGAGYSYASGTSMATPHAAGAAALLAAASPSLGTAGLRAALLGGVDVLGSLAGRVATSGRLNGMRSLLIAAPGTVVPPALAPSSAIPTPAPAPSPAPEPTPTPVPTPLPAPVIDQRSPRVSLRVRPRQRLVGVARRGLSATVACTERCTVRLRVLIAPRATRAARAQAIASTRLTLKAPSRVRLRLSRRTRARVARLGSARLIVTARATDRAGNSRTARARVLVRR